MSSRFAVREADDGDLPAIAKVHLAAYSKAHFTSRLSSATLQAYYGLFLGDGSHVIVLTPHDAMRDVLGFAVFGYGIGAKIANFKREHRGAIAVAALRNPLAASGKILNRLASSFSPKATVEPAPFLLLSIAVARQGIGAGGVLLESLVASARATGEQEVGLFVNCDNLGAINSYVAHGFRFRAFRAGQFYMERSAG